MQIVMIQLLSTVISQLRHQLVLWLIVFSVH